MYIYEGFNPESEERKRLEFEDEYEAISFGRDNAYEFPEYTVTDTETDEIIDSNEIAQDDEDVAWENMYPEGMDD